VSWYRNAAKEGVGDAALQRFRPIIAQRLDRRQGREGNSEEDRLEDFPDFSLAARFLEAYTPFFTTAGGTAIT
jgi:hypothetical protein